MKRGIKQVLTDVQIRGAESEILLIDLLKDPSVITCYGYVADPRQFMVVLELAPYGSLADFLENSVSYPVLPFILCVAWLSDVMDALKHIHSKMVSHKNIKAENLLVFMGLNVKLCDFGLSKRCL